MKCNVMLWVFTLLTMSVYAQLETHYLYPSSAPTDIDTINSILRLLTPGGAHKRSSSLGFNNDTIKYQSCYFKGNVLQEDYVQDTVVIHPLQYGIYHYIIEVKLTPTNSDINCDMVNLQKSQYDTIITVSKYSGISYESRAQLQAVMLNADMVQLYAPHNATASVQVYDALGMLHYSNQSQVAEGKNEIRLDLPSLPSGLYLYHIQLGEQRRVLKLVKQ